MKKITYAIIIALSLAFTSCIGITEQCWDVTTKVGETTTIKTYWGSEMELLAEIAEEKIEYKIEHGVTPKITYTKNTNSENQCRDNF